MTARTRRKADDLLMKYSVRPAKLIIPLVFMLSVSPGLPVRDDFLQAIQHMIVILLIGGVTWLIVSLMGVVEELLDAKYRIDVADNLTSRRIKTQVYVLRRTAATVVTVVGFAVMLMTFPTIWNIGAGLFASAGAAGLILGLAAKPTFSSLLAGIQIALTEPIRLDDVVIVEGEWGRIEEILAT